MFLFEISILTNRPIVSEVKAIRSWLAPEDRVLSHAVEMSSHLAHDREELTCLWMGPALARFLRSPSKTLTITGKPGSGKTVLASVIVDHLQHPIGGVSYKTLFVPISKYTSIYIYPPAPTQKKPCDTQLAELPYLT